MKQIGQKVLMMMVLGLAACSPANEVLAHDGLSTYREQAVLPKLHVIESKAFSAPYSCKGNYEKSALFISNYSKIRNSPELLFNGACGSELYVHAITAGNDIGLISDLGDVPLESVTAAKALNYDRVVGRDNVFKETQPVQEGHTYSVLVARSEMRVLYAFRVTSLNRSTGQMTIKYAVKTYELLSPAKVTPGFEWEQGNK